MTMRAPERGTAMARRQQGGLCGQSRARAHLLNPGSLRAGIVLTGHEVKSCRNGKIQLSDAYATVKNGELWLYNAHISAYSYARVDGTETVRPRKLLMHRKEIDKLEGKTRQKGLTLVPMRIYTKDDGQVRDRSRQGQATPRQAGRETESCGTGRGARIRAAT